MHRGWVWPSCTVDMAEAYMTSGVVPQDCMGQVASMALVPKAEATIRPSPWVNGQHATKGNCILLRPGYDPWECLGYLQPAFPPPWVGTTGGGRCVHHGWKCHLCTTDKGETHRASGAVPQDCVGRVASTTLAPNAEAKVRPSPWANEQACDPRYSHTAVSRVQPMGMPGLLTASIPPLQCQKWGSKSR